MQGIRDSKAMEQGKKGRKKEPKKQKSHSYQGRNDPG
jgi:hypothetical protein